MRGRSHFALITALAVVSCKRSAPSEAEGTPHVEARTFVALPAPAAPLGRTRGFCALACNGTSVYAVSGDGVVFSENLSGADPLIEALPDAPPLTAVTAASSVVAVGAQGSIVRRDREGPTWKRETTPVMSDLHGVAEIADWIVAVGTGGTIIARRTTGTATAWTSLPSPTQEDLFAVSPCSADRTTTKLCAVGNAGILLVGDATPAGVVFRAVASGTNQTLRAVAPAWRLDGPAAYAVGDRGTIVAIDTAGAHVVPSGTTEDLFGVAEGEVERSKIEGSFAAVVAVGKRGTVIAQASGRRKVASFKSLRVSTEADIVAIVRSREFGFVVMVRGGAMHFLGLAANARHPFPPE